MGDQVMARRNGEYTCLDCLRQCSDDCMECFNWSKFELDDEIYTLLPYEERSKRNERKYKEWIAERLQKTLQED